MTFELDDMMFELSKRAESGDLLAVQAVSAIALLLMGYRPGDELPVDEKQKMERMQ